MIVIIKRYILEGSGQQVLDMPAKARILHVGPFQGKHALWTQEERDSPSIRRNFIMVTDSNFIEITTKHKHVGTVMSPRNEMAFHIFEETGNGH
jgi:hypothetical protein